jgi:hypothetical protein
LGELFGNTEWLGDVLMDPRCDPFGAQPIFVGFVPASHRYRKGNSRVTIKTAGELRGFLAGILEGIRDGKVDVDDATAIAKVAGQINNSLAIEAKTAIEMKRLGKDDHVFGSTQIASGDVSAISAQPDVWCEQCEKRVSAEAVAACGSRFCKARAA